MKNKKKYTHEIVLKSTQLNEEHPIHRPFNKRVIRWDRVNYLLKVTDIEVCSTFFRHGKIDSQWPRTSVSNTLEVIRTD